jgi:hypothetical protein
MGNDALAMTVELRDTYGQAAILICPSWFCLPGTLATSVTLARHVKLSYRLDMGILSRRARAREVQECGNVQLEKYI